MAAQRQARHRTDESVSACYTGDHETPITQLPRSLEHECPGVGSGVQPAPTLPGRLKKTDLFAAAWSPALRAADSVVLCR